MKALRMPKEYIRLLADSENWLKARTREYTLINSPVDSRSYLAKFCLKSLGYILKILIEAADSCSSVSQKENTSKELHWTSVGAPRQLQLKNNICGKIPVPVFLSFLKYFRQACYDLFQQSGLKEDQALSYTTFTGLSFDWIELLVLERDIGMQTGRSSVKQARHTPFSLKKKNTYLTVFESLHTPVILLDDQHKIIDFNREAARLFGNLKRNDPLIADGGQLAQCLKAIQEKVEVLTLYRTEECKFEIESRTSEGIAYYKILLKKSFDANHTFHGTIIMLQDLTEQYVVAQNLKEAKIRAEEADELKTSFLANMSHEIRTPMNAIVGFTELMLNEQYKHTEQKEFLKLIRSSSRDLLNIIDDIIDIAKLESKQLKVKYKPCEVYQMLRDLQVVFSETLRRYGIHEDVILQVDVSEKDKHVLINTDAERLKQVLSNLLSNAVKFTNEGFIQYGYRVVDDSNLLFFVKDSGSGIPAEMQHKIFDRFFQMKEHQSKNLGGAGLGLAICKNLIHLLGGEIWIESEVNKGSTFSFRIPYYEVIHKTDVRKMADRDGNEDFLRLEGKNIVIAEDDEVNFLFMEEMLNRTGAELIRARNGLEAIDIAESLEQIDLILMDMKMPEVNGIEATKYIRTIRPDIPIIALTAFAMEGDKKTCLNAGCCAYIAKPVERHKLFLLMERYMLSHQHSAATIVSAK